MIELVNKCNNCDNRPNLEKKVRFGRRLFSISVQISKKIWDLDGD